MYRRYSIYRVLFELYFIIKIMRFRVAQWFFEVTDIELFNVGARFVFNMNHSSQMRFGLNRGITWCVDSYNGMGLLPELTTWFYLTTNCGVWLNRRGSLTNYNRKGSRERGKPQFVKGGKWMQSWWSIVRSLKSKTKLLNN